MILLVRTRCSTFRFVRPSTCSRSGSTGLSQSLAISGVFRRQSLASFFLVSQPAFRWNIWAAIIQPALQFWFHPSGCCYSYKIVLCVFVFCSSVRLLTSSFVPSWNFDNFFVVTNNLLTVACICLSWLSIVESVRSQLYTRLRQWTTAWAWQRMAALHPELTTRSVLNRRTSTS